LPTRFSAFTISPRFVAGWGQPGREKIVREFNLNLSTVMRAELFFVAWIAAGRIKICSTRAKRNLL